MQEKKQVPNLGTHIMGQLYCKNTDALVNCKPTLTFLEEAIRDSGLRMVAKASHVFDNGGFTIIIALAESHLSVHSWPEHKLLTCDIYVCNLSKNYSNEARIVYKEIKEYFNVYQAKESEFTREL